MVADEDEDVRDAQKKFLEERQVHANACTCARTLFPRLPRPSLPPHSAPLTPPACCPMPHHPIAPGLPPSGDELCGGLQKIKQQYDTDVESTFVNAEQFEGKKSIYTVVVTGLVVIAFVAPMLQFFYYTGGD